MLRSPLRPNVVTAWVGVLVVAGAAALSGVPITLANSALWFAVCVVPPAVMLMMWRGAPPAMEEILCSDCVTPSIHGRLASRLERG